MNRRDKLARAGIVLPEGSKVLKVKLPKAKPAFAPQSYRYAPGILLARIVVNSRPIPWKAPFVTRTGNSIKDPSMLRWQAEVKKAAIEEMRSGVPYSHSVRIDFTFNLKYIKGRTLPDTTNLTKSTEDAIQKIAISNDVNVVENAARRIVGDIDQATILVYSAQENPPCKPE